MGRRKLETEARRLSIGVTLPYGLVKLLDREAEARNVTRSVIIEKAVLNQLYGLTAAGKEDHHA